MKETIQGFDIEKRVLTKEEINRKITVERFTEFHYAAGEDFLDQTSEGDVKIFCGWLLHKYPQHSTEILEVVNNNYSELMTYQGASFFPVTEDCISFYTDFAEFCNQTGALKQRVNQVLIQVTEHYAD